jgi:hypothetical protein
MDKHTMELTRSQWMALAAQHLQCQEKLDECVDCSQEPEVVARPDELLALLMSKWKKRKRCRSRSTGRCLWRAHECGFVQGHKGRHRCRGQIEMMDVILP